MWHAFDDDSVEVTDSEVVGRMKGGGTLGGWGRLGGRAARHARLHTGTHTRPKPFPRATRAGNDFMAYLLFYKARE